MLTRDSFQMRVSATYTACIYSVLVYDWLLSLPDEYKYIWRSKPTTVNGLYIILRYWPLVKFAISLYLSNTWMSYERCHDWTAFQVNSNLPITICVSTLLALRLYALYGRNIWVSSRKPDTIRILIITDLCTRVSSCLLSSESLF